MARGYMSWNLEAYVADQEAQRKIVTPGDIAEMKKKIESQMEEPARVNKLINTVVSLARKSEKNPGIQFFCYGNNNADNKIIAENSISLPEIAKVPLLSDQPIFLRGLIEMRQSIQMAAQATLSTSLTAKAFPSRDKGNFTEESMLLLIPMNPGSDEIMPESPIGIDWREIRIYEGLSKIHSRSRTVLLSDGNEETLSKKVFVQAVLSAFPFIKSNSQATPEWNCAKLAEFERQVAKFFSAEDYKQLLEFLKECFFEQ